MVVHHKESRSNKGHPYSFQSISQAHIITEAWIQAHFGGKFLKVPSDMSTTIKNKYVVTEF